MPRTNVFIASRTEQENYILEKKLESLEHEFEDVKFAGVHVAGLALTVDRLTIGVILNLVEWTTKEAVLIQELRRAGYHGSILVTAKADPTIVARDLRGMSDIAFLAKPFDAKEILGIVRKQLMARTVVNQRHRRYTTSQDAELEIESSKKSLSARVRNLSKGGAYLEFATPSNVMVGEEIRVRLELKDLQRTYTLPARVIWANRHGSRGLGIGVEFTGPGDVQRSILGY